MLSESGELKIKNILIFNTLGQVQKEMRDIGSFRQEVDVTSQPSGNYFIRIETNKGVAYRRFSISK
ncbi:hypothetical protein D3C87_1989570 [compost metagenome]